MVFTVGKYYRHSGGGEDIHILCSMRTTMYGHTMIAETSQGNFRPVGRDEVFRHRTGNR